MERLALPRSYWKTDLLLENERMRELSEKLSLSINKRNYVLAITNIDELVKTKSIDNIFNNQTILFINNFIRLGSKEITKGDYFIEVGSGKKIFAFKKKSFHIKPWKGRIKNLESFKGGLTQILLFNLGGIFTHVIEIIVSSLLLLFLPYDDMAAGILVEYWVKTFLAIAVNQLIWNSIPHVIHNETDSSEMDNDALKVIKVIQKVREKRTEE